MPRPAPPPAAARRVRRRVATVAIALLMGASAAWGASFIEGTGGSVVIATPPGTADAAPYLVPGGPWIRHVVDLGIAANDFAIADDLLLVAADKGLSVLRLQAGEMPRGAGTVPVGPLSSVTVDAAGRAWAAGPDGLVAIDVGVPETPRVVARYRTPVEPRAFVVHGDRGYVLLPHELQVIDLDAGGPTDGSGTDGPGVIARHVLDFDARGIASSADGTVYIAAGDAGLVVHRPDAPDPPFVLRDTGAPALDVAVDGERVYVAHGPEGLSVLAIRPAGGADDGLDWLGELRGTRPIAGMRARGAQALAHDGAGALFLLDVANPRAMAFTALLSDDGCCETYRYAAGGAVALAGGGRLIAFDLADAPPALSNEGLAFGQGVNYGGQRRVVIEDGLAYVADWFSGLHIYDLSTPHRPQLLSSLHTGGSPKGVVVRDGLAYVADDDHGLRIIDISDTHRPREVSQLPLPGLAYTPVLDGDRLYVAVHHGGLVVVDVSDPAVPALAVHHDTPGKAWSLRVRDGIAWVADDDAGLLAIAVDGEAPRQLGRFDPGGQVEEVVLDGDIAWLAVYDQGIVAVDIGDPAAPAQVAHLRTRGNPRGLALRDDLLLVADWLAGVTIVDISDPATPHALGRRGTDGAAWGLALQGDTAFVADWWGGISLLDITDPAHPVPAGRYPSREMVRAVSAEGGFAFIAQGSGGLQVFDIANPLNPTWVTGIGFDDARDAVVAGDHAFVLHGDGRRVAVVDIGNPFQARLVKDVGLAHRARALRGTGDGAALALGKGGWSRIGPDARATLLGGDAPADALAMAGKLLVVEDDARLRTLDGDGRAAEVARLPAVGALHGDADRVAVHVPGQGLRVLAPAAGRLEEVARVPWSGPVDALYVSGDDLHIAAGRTLHIVRIDADGGWRVSGSYQAMDAITGLAVHDGIVYLAGSPALRALEPVPAIEIGAVADDRARIGVPPGLPPGVYGIAAGRVADAAPPASILLRNAFTVEPLRFGAMRPAPAQ